MLKNAMGGGTFACKLKAQIKKGTFEIAVNAYLLAKLIDEEERLLVSQGLALLFWIKALVEEMFISKMSIRANNFNCNYRVEIGSDRC